MKYFDLLPYLRTVVFAKAKDILSSPLDLLPFVSERINVIKLVCWLYVFFYHGAHFFVGHRDRRKRRALSERLCKRYAIY